MPTILITGASGMVGSSIQKQFTDAGYTVRTLVRDKKKANLNQIRLKAGLPAKSA